MITPAHLVIGLLAAVIIGLSKTAVPGGGLLATPLLASIVGGRQTAGTTLPLLLVADVFAVVWFARRARHDVLRPLALPTACGFAGGALFFILARQGGRVLELTLAWTVIALVVVQAVRLVRRAPAATPGRVVATGAGLVGGFATFVSNAAGPVINTYFTRLALERNTLIGTSAIYYFCVNVAKVPLYLAIGRWASGGGFFTRESLAFDALLAPAVAAAAVGGRALLPRIPQRVFTIAVLVLAAAAALRLLLL